MKVILISPTNKASQRTKNRIREHGDKWEVLDLPPGVIKMSHKTGTPIRSLKTGDWRWLDSTNFEIISESE